MWAEELEERPKLCMVKELDSGGLEATCVGVRRKKIRKTDGGKGGTAELQVEVGNGEV